MYVLYVTYLVAYSARDGEELKTILEGLVGDEAEEMKEKLLRTVAEPDQPLTFHTTVTFDPIWGRYRDITLALQKEPEVEEED